MRTLSSPVVARRRSNWSLIAAVVAWALSARTAPIWRALPSAVRSESSISAAKALVTQSSSVERSLILARSPSSACRRWPSTSAMRASTLSSVEVASLSAASCPRVLSVRLRPRSSSRAATSAACLSAPSDTPAKRVDLVRDLLGGAPGLGCDLGQDRLDLMHALDEAFLERAEIAARALGDLAAGLGSRPRPGEARR